MSEVADGILAVAAQLLSAREWFASGTVALPCTLWTVGAADPTRPSFVGLMPTLGSSVPAEPEGRALLERELLLHLRAMRRARVDFGELQRELIARAETSAHGSPARLVAEVVRALD
jgi:hypothetical protein